MSEDLYGLLGVSKTASDDEIKKAYKRLAVKHHPDRNPDNKEEANKIFQKINRAYKVLSNPDARRNYDQFGVIEGENDMGANGMGGMPQGMNPFDMFANFFNGGGGMPSGFPSMDPNMYRRNLKSPDKKLTISLSLKDIYLGKTVPIDFQRIIKCDKCDGLGTPNKDFIKSCGVCGGKGKIVRMQQMGPMIHQTVQPCYQCAGSGKIVEKGNECGQCCGRKSVTQNRHVDCYVRAGAAAGSHISFKNESDWMPDFADVGDLVVFVDVKNEEAGMRREGDNLVMKRSISLLEALTQTVIFFRHLDERVIKVTYDGIIRAGATMVIEGEGMPKFNDPMFKGNLILHFDVVFPTHIEKERAKYLVKILPVPKKQIWDIALESTPESELTVKTMEELVVNKDSQGQQQQPKQDTGGFYGYPDNDEFEQATGNGGGAHPIECATQ